MLKYQSILKRLAVIASVGTAFIVLGSSGSAAAAVNTCTWTGAVDTLWSTAGNWSGCGGTAPQNGDNLAFDNSSEVIDVTTQNDLIDLQVGTITLTGTNPSADIELSGNRIFLSGGFTEDSISGNDITLDITLTNDQTWTSSGSGIGIGGSSSTLDIGNHTLTVDNMTSDTIIAHIIGSGTINKVGDASSLLIINNVNPGFTGNLIITNGKISFFDFDLGALGTATVTVHDGATLEMRIITVDAYEIANTMYVAGQGVATGGALRFINFSGMGNAQVNLSGAIVLNDDTKIAASDVEVSLTGSYEAKYHSVTFADGSGTSTYSNQADVIQRFTSLTSGSGYILTDAGTSFTAASVAAESSLSVADNAYNYPLGMTNFSYTTTNGATNTITLVFATKQTPSQVVARKFNSNTGQFSTIPGATITATTLLGQPALQVSYAITDNGSLDQNPTLGAVTDPVGLATVQTIAPDTGLSRQQPAAFAIAIFSLCAGIVVTVITTRKKYAAHF